MSKHTQRDEPKAFRDLVEHIMHVEHIPYAVARTRALAYWCDPIWQRQQRAAEFWRFVAWLLFLAVCIALSAIGAVLWSSLVAG